ncbi:MAG: TetR/AcrR family transcriptional regulator [Mycobacterium sp.]
MTSPPSSDQDPVGGLSGVRTTAAEADAERNQLLLAARGVLERSGWWGFKVEGVLRQAGLSTRSFYRHFEKKNDLLMALMDRELGGAAIHLARVTAGGATPAERVRNYISATLDMAYNEELVKPSSLFASHWRELRHEYPDEIDQCAARMVAPLAEAIADGVAGGEFTSEDPVADAQAIFNLVAGMAADQASYRATPRQEIEHIALPFIARALGISGGLTTR